jgi:hypothetical protein
VFLKNGFVNYLPGLASNSDPPDLSLLYRKDYRRYPPELSSSSRKVTSYSGRIIIT